MHPLSIISLNPSKTFLSFSERHRLWCLLLNQRLDNRRRSRDLDLSGHFTSSRRVQRLLHDGYSTDEVLAAFPQKDSDGSPVAESAL